MKTFPLLLAAIICSMAYGCSNDIENGQMEPDLYQPILNPLDTLTRDTLYWFPDEHFPQDIDSLVKRTDQPAFYGLIPYKGRKFNPIHFYKAFSEPSGKPGKSLPDQLREQILIGGVTIAITEFESNEYVFIRKSHLYPDLILWSRVENFFPIHDDPEYPNHWGVGEKVDENSDLYKQLLNQKTSLLWSLY